MILTFDLYGILIGQGRRFNPPGPMSLGRMVKKSCVFQEPNDIHGH